MMAYLGVVPSEHSSGGTKSRGGVTKTGGMILDFRARQLPDGSVVMR